MEHTNFAKILKEQRVAYGVSQERLAILSGISCHYISNIETGKTVATQEKQEHLLNALERLNPDRPLTLLIDYLRIRFPTTNAVHIIEDLMRIKMSYMCYENYGLYSYTGQYIHGNIVVMVSDDERKGILLELKGQGCRQFETYLSAQSRSWYDFLQDAIEMHGVVKRIDLAINDHTGILDIPELTRKCENEECISVFRSYKSYRSGDLHYSTLQEQHKGEMGNTLYIGSMKSDVYFCLYEKAYEQFVKNGIPLEDAPIKNRFEIRLKNERAVLAVDDLIARQDAEQTAFSIINRYLRFVDKDTNSSKENWELNPMWACFIADKTGQLRLTTDPQPYSLDRTMNWLSRQVAPSLKSVMEIDKRNGTSLIENMLSLTALSERHKKRIEQVTLPVEQMIIRKGD